MWMEFVVQNGEGEGEGGRERERERERESPFLPAHHSTNRKLHSLCLLFEKYLKSI
jgi:hypothetical protein